MQGDVVGPVVNHIPCWPHVVGRRGAPGVGLNREAPPVARAVVAPVAEDQHGVRDAPQVLLPGEHQEGTRQLRRGHAHAEGDPGRADAVLRDASEPALEALPVGAARKPEPGRGVVLALQEVAGPTLVGARSPDQRVAQRVAEQRALHRPRLPPGPGPTHAPPHEDLLLQALRGLGDATLREQQPAHILEGQGLQDVLDGQDVEDIPEGCQGLAALTYGRGFRHGRRMGIPACEKGTRVEPWKRAGPRA
mmetsp:Transcript_83802/g.264555  ORF Transcript_83802/g.264555 Transcript_83802/m.264555 type:complete len:249 (+) Transcript_83802:528-1274(+)